MKKSRLFLLLALFALALGLCGCAAEEEATQQTQGKTFVFGDTTFNAENGEPDINPHRDNSGWACIRYGVGALAGGNDRAGGCADLAHHAA